MAKLSDIEPSLTIKNDKRIKEPQRLSALWKEKMQIRNRMATGRSRDDGIGYTVKWDNPDLPKGEDVTVKHFKTMDAAMKYGVHIAKTVDLRREADHENTLAIRTGYNPVPEPSSVVPVAIETPFGLRELTEVDVWPERYDPDGFKDKKITPDLDKVRGI